MDKSKIFYLTRENWDVSEFNAITETYFTDPEYLKAKSDIDKGRGFITEKDHEGNIALWHVYYDLLRKVRTRYYYAVEIALAIPEDNAFLISTDIKDLANFVKAREKEIIAILDQYRREREIEYSGFHDPEAITNLPYAGVIFIDPEAPPPPPPGRAVSYVYPAPGQPPLQEYPPFLELVEEFKQAVKQRRKLYAQERETTHLTHTIIPRKGALLYSVKNHKQIEKISALIAGETEEGEQYLDGRVIKLDKDIEIQEHNIAAWPNFNDYLSPKQTRVFFGLASYANSTPDCTPHTFEGRINKIEVSADINTIVEEVFNCEGKTARQIREYKKELIREMNNILNAPPCVKVTTRKDGKAGEGKEFVKVEPFRLINEVSFELTKRGGRVTYSILVDDVAFFFPKGVAKKLKKDSVFSLYVFLYTKRNETQIKGVYYPRKVSCKVADLLTEARQDDNAKTNPREARARLKKCLDSLKKVNVIIDYYPDHIPTDRGAIMEITFPNDNNSSSFSKYNTKQIEAKNE